MCGTGDFEPPFPDFMVGHNALYILEIITISNLQKMVRGRPASLGRPVECPQGERNPQSSWGTNRSLDLPRVDDEGPARLEVPRVTSHHMKPVTKGGRRQEPVDARDGDPGLQGPSRELAPDAGCVHV